MFLKVAPMRSVIRFGKKRKLSPGYIGPFEIIEQIGEVVYRLAILPTLSKRHHMFHVFILKKYL